MLDVEHEHFGQKHDDCFLPPSPVPAVFDGLPVGMIQRPVLPQMVGHLPSGMIPYAYVPAPAAYYHQ